MQGWERGNSGLSSVVWEQTDTCLAVYKEDPSRVEQDANNESRIAHGGYSDRQLEELVQNAVDAAKRGGCRIEVVLTRETLYVANDGDPFSAEGVRSVMASDISTKDDESVGKFGIGFKSILAISRGPKVLSRSVSFSFDAAWAEETLRDEGHDALAYPTMRLAKTIDPVIEAERDPHLAALMPWASTVIVVPLAKPFHDISRRLYSFQDEFVLFSPHITHAVFRNLAESDPGPSKPPRPEEREVTVSRGDHGEILLQRRNLRTGTSSTTRWVVERVRHTPSDRAVTDGGYVATRAEVDIQYALRVPPGSDDGEFWAYFPTRSTTTLSGIVNAPWKLSDDRRNLLDGAFNEEILHQVPRLFARAVGNAEVFTHPVKVLDAMPARGREPRGWADDYINEPFFDVMRTQPILPDALGALRVPSALSWIGDLGAPRRTREGLPDWFDRWSAVPGAPHADWVHADAYSSPERRTKVERLRGGRSGAITTAVGMDKWLEALVGDGSVERSAEAIALAAHIMRELDTLLDPGTARRIEQDVRAAKIVRLEDGTFVAPTRGKIFVRVEGEEAADDVKYVDPSLASSSSTKADLERLGVVVMDRTGQLRAILTRIATGAGSQQLDTLWTQAWAILRELPVDVAARVVREELDGPTRLSLRVRTAAGRWVSLAQSYLHGALIPASGARDKELLIDPRFHGRDEELLKELGAVDAPKWTHEAPREAWLDEFEDAAAQAFLAQLKGGARPQQGLLVFEGATPPWPMQPLSSMSAEGRLAATEYLLAVGIGSPWTVRHKSNSSYGRVSVVSAEAWFLQKHGLLQTSFGPLPMSRVLQAKEEIDEAVLPIVDLDDKLARALGLKESVQDYREDDWAWLKMIADKWVGPEDDARRSEFYTWLPGNIRPETLVVRVGHLRSAVALENIGVTADRAVYESMLESQIPALLAGQEDDAERFIDVWGMPRGTDLLQEEIVAEPAGEPMFLVDAFPPLKLRLELELQDLMLQPAARIEKMIATARGQISRQIAARRDAMTLFVTARGRREQLKQISEVLQLGLDTLQIEKILAEMEATATNAHRARIRAADSDEARLLAAVGVGALRRIVPQQALDALEAAGPVSDQDVAALAMAAHGIAILKQLRPALEERGLQPPKEWAGRRLTRDWVASLGFPVEWSGFPSVGRPSVEVIDGPAELNKLHPYQQLVTRNIQALLAGIGEDRGVVSLPTGAGKTRVTVEALVDAIREGRLHTEEPIVWIAQSDELCEQAAETWTYVWRAIGSRVPMRLGRLWGTNEVPEEPGAFQLVIATVDKLYAITQRGGDDYGWLTSPSVVVVDEAHTSIASSYTTVLGWLGRSARDRKVGRKPLIGLTATPFRGTSDEETRRLVNRYDGNRLDRGAFQREDPYEELQAMGVLARVEQRILDGVEVALTKSDQDEIERMRRIPGQVNDVIGSDLVRTQRIVDSIAEHPDDWTVLAFTPSVESARVLAALLSHRGIPAVSISADTDMAARRFYIEEFKAGRIRVLTNFNVLTQGFDAPKVQAVYVARPTFSPNVYQQMIGRGLRGPLNGGSEEVLIVNVQDNFAQYGELLAFKQFDYLWTPRGVRA